MYQATYLLSPIYLTNPLLHCIKSGRTFKKVAFTRILICCRSLFALQNLRNLFREFREKPSGESAGSLMLHCSVFLSGFVILCKAYFQHNRNVLNKFLCFVTVEHEQDYLTCGDCQREFLLSDIVKFIQHKVNRCNKENVDPFEDNEFDNESEENEAVSGVINARRTSISAPIARRGTPELREKLSPRPSRSVSIGGDDAPSGDEENNEEKEGSNKHKSSHALQNGGTSGRPSRPSCVDAESNTTNSGTSRFALSHLPQPPLKRPETCMNTRVFLLLSLHFQTDRLVHAHSYENMLMAI